MDGVGWTLATALMAAVGYSHAAWGADSAGPLVIVAGTIAIGTLCLVAGLTWAFVACALGRRWGHNRTTTGAGGIQDQGPDPSNEPDDPWGPRPR
jgi:hypothetical protein